MDERGGADENREWDWIVIGTGVGGSTFGHALAKNGRRVLFIEKGADQRVNKQKKSGHMLESLIPKPSARSSQDYTNTGRSQMKIWDATRNRFIKPILGAGTGGSSALFGMVMERFWKEDFEPLPGDAEPNRSLPRWPVSFNEMEPYYKQAEALYGVSSQTSDPLRADQTFQFLPRPALQEEGRQLKKTLAGRGLHPYTLPLARRWGTPCPFCQSQLCEHDCKNDAAKMCLEPALRHHGASLLTGAEVVEITADTTRVTGVQVMVDGQRSHLRAANVALAAGAIQTPLLLLKSRSALWPRGLANGSGLVGRNLMRHYIDLLGIPSFSSRNGGDQKEIGLNDFYIHDGRKYGTLADFGRMPPMPVVLEDLDNDVSTAGPWVQALWRLARPAVGWVLRHLFARTRFLALIVEDRPFEDNRVEEGLADDEVRIHYAIQPNEQARIQRVRKLVRRALGPWAIFLPNAHNTKLLAHACGTCRMGDDPRTSVVDRFNRAHGIENLYVVDSSFFPSSGGVNPALTIAANALRVAALVTESREIPKMEPWTQDQPARKKKVLFMPTSFSLAHVGRLVTLAQALSQENFEVTFACDQRDHRFIPACFERRHATSLRPEEFRRRLEQGRALIDAPLLRKQVEEDLVLMRSLRVDLVVGDFRPSLAISAKVAGVPYLNIVNAHWSPWSKEIFEAPAALDRAPFKWLGSCLARKLINRFLPLGFAWQSRSFNQVRREHGLAPIGNSIRDVYTAGDYTVYPDLAEMVPTPGAPASHRHIGPVQWEPEIPLPGWWQELPEEKPLVYVTAGSTGRTDFIPKILEALAHLPVVVAVATAGRVAVPPVPGRVYVADYLPGLPLSGRASLVINNGGAGGVYQALAAGVPVLGVAANMDQCMVMKPVERSGAGLLVLAGDADTCPWLKVISGLLDSRPAKRAAESLARRLEAESAPESFHRLVNQILGMSLPVGAAPETNPLGFAERV